MERDHERLNSPKIFNISPGKNLSIEIKDIEDLKVSSNFYAQIVSSSQKKLFFP